MNLSTIDCPCCGKTTQEGFVWLNAILAGTLEWSHQKPDLAFWKINAGDASVMDPTALVPAKSVQQAYRCGSCGAVVIAPQNDAATPS